MPVVTTGERCGLLKKHDKEEKYNAAFDQCMDFLARMIEKYGDKVELPKAGITEPATTDYHHLQQDIAA